MTPVPAGRYFRGLTAFDLLGNLVPGTVVLAAVLASLPNPPTPATPGGYLLFGVVAFSLGHFAQRFASVATGDRRSFDWTMDAARQQRRSPEGAAVGGDDGDTGETGRDETGGRDVQPADEVPNGLRQTLVGMFCHPRRLGAHAAVLLVDAIFDPLVWSLRHPRGTVLEEHIIANRAWKHLHNTYELRPGTESYSVLFHLMSSELDDVAAPSRAVRSQAIRNFHRGMWTATWTALTIWTTVVVVDNFVEPGTWILGIEYHRAVLLNEWTPFWHLSIVLAVLGFRYLSEVYEEEFIEYLFTDFVVATKEGGVGDGST